MQSSSSPAARQIIQLCAAIDGVAGLGLGAYLASQGQVMLGGIIALGMLVSGAVIFFFVAPRLG